MIYKAVRVLTVLEEKKSTKHFNLSLDATQVLFVTLKFPATVELRVIILILKGEGRGANFYLLKA